jgi:predicted LPLAT superfamily acyltransferase
VKGDLDWHRRGERGSLWGMRLTAWLYRYVGKGLARLLLYPIVAYFYLTDRRARAASLDYLCRVYATEEGRGTLGSPPGQLQVFRHMMEFGIVTLDRLGFWLGRLGDFALECEGLLFLDEIARRGRGALVVGAHFGSFEAMRLLADVRSFIPVNVFMYTRHAERINRIFSELDELGHARVRVVPVAPGSFAHAMEAKACIERGEVVAVLADRLPPHETERAMTVDFLGAPALLPQGPWHLAALLDCPVLMMIGVREGTRRYRVHVEQLAETLKVPRARRGEVLERHAQAFADRLAHYCKLAPHQWFNFYDFWSESRPHG